MAALRLAARQGGLKGYWKQRLELALQQPDVGKLSMARAYLNVGDHDQALAWWKKLYEERGSGVRFLKMPEWDPLRADPRFQDLLRRVNGAEVAGPLPSDPPRYGSGQSAAVSPDL